MRPSRDAGVRPLGRVSALARLCAAVSLCLAAAQAIPVAAQPAAVVTQGQVTVAGAPVRYTATTGKLPLYDAGGRLRARMFYVAYTVAPQPSEGARPLTFFFNGGPGSSTVWLHLGAFGPVHLSTPPPGAPSSQAYTLQPNAQSLIGVTDMVFLDAVDTGYSRPLDPTDAKLYLGIDEDADSFVQAVQRYVADTRREASPKYLFGESYGTMRAAILADRLQDKGTPVEGLIMLSTILNFGHFASGLDRLTVDLMPSYAAIAWYHKAAAAAVGVTLEDWVAQARRFAEGPYSTALAAGNRVAPADKAAVAEEIHRLTGLPTEEVLADNLRIPQKRYRADLLKRSREVIGYNDGRYTAPAPASPAAPLPDAAKAAVAEPYAAAFDTYVRDSLHYRDAEPYLADEEDRITAVWDWAHQPPGAERQNALANATLDLASALRKEPRLRVLVLSGYYDLTTPFSGTEFDLAHILGREGTDGRIRTLYFPSGHMIYIDEPSRVRMETAVACFITRRVGC